VISAQYERKLCGVPSTPSFFPASGLAIVPLLHAITRDDVLKGRRTPRQAALLMKRLLSYGLRAYFTVRLFVNRFFPFGSSSEYNLILPRSYKGVFVSHPVQGAQDNRGKFLFRPSKVLEHVVLAFTTF
jgi:hypothetical protein